MIILNDKSERTTVGGSQLETSRFHIDESAIGHVSMILEDMYKFPERAVLREYLANAIDAHVLAGTDKQVDVTLPVFFDNRLIIRDYGPGLSKEDTDRLLRGYGASGEEKRTSNDFIGGFGIGAKCAYAITKTFTYTIWHGGMKRVWINSKDDFDVSVATLASEEPSDEPTGIEVAIPVTTEEFTWSTKRTFQRELNRVVPFLEKPEMLNFKKPAQDPIQGTCPDMEYYIPKLPDPVASVPLTLSDGDTEFEVTIDVHSRKGNNSSTSPLYRELSLPFLNVGGIAIDLDSSIIDNIITETLKKHPNKKDVKQLLKNSVIRMPIGSVQLAPTRESVKYSPRTLKILNLLVQTITSPEFQAEVLSQLVSTQTPLRQRFPIASEYGLEIPESKWVSLEFGFMFPHTVEFSRASIYSVCANSSTGIAVNTGNMGMTQTDRVLFTSNLISSDDPLCLYITRDSECLHTRVQKQMTTWLVENRLLPLPTSDGRHYLGACLVTACVAEHLVGNPREEIPWVKDGSVILITDDMLPEIDETLFATPVASKRKRRKTNAALTKLTEFTGERLTAVNSQGAYLRKGDIKALRKENKSGVCIVLGPDYSVANDLVLPKLYDSGSLRRLAGSVRALRLNEEMLPVLLPKMFLDPDKKDSFLLYAMNHKDYTKANFDKGPSGMEPLFTYIKRTLINSIKRKETDLEYLFRVLEHKGRSPSLNCFITSVLAQDCFKSSSGVQELARYEAYANTLDDLVKRRTEAWAEVIWLTILDMHIFDFGYPGSPPVVSHICTEHKTSILGGHGLLQTLIKQGKDKTSNKDNHPLTMTQWLRDTPDEFLPSWLRLQAVWSSDTSVQNPLEHALALVFKEVPFVGIYGDLLDLLRSLYYEDDITEIRRDGTSGNFVYQPITKKQNNVFTNRTNLSMISRHLDQDPDFQAYVKRKIAHNKKHLA